MTAYIPDYEPSIKPYARTPNDIQISLHPIRDLEYVIQGEWEYLDEDPISTRGADELEAALHLQVLTSGLDRVLTEHRDLAEATIAQVLPVLLADTEVDDHFSRIWLAPNAKRNVTEMIESLMFGHFEGSPS